MYSVSRRRGALVLYKCSYLLLLCFYLLLLCLYLLLMLRLHWRQQRIKLVPTCVPQLCNLLALKLCLQC